MNEQKLKPKHLRTIKRRKFLYKSALTLGIGALGLKLWDIQVLNFADFYSLSTSNRIRIKLVPAPRGTIYDHKGVVLVTNSPAYNVTVDMANVKDLDALLNSLAYILNSSVDSLKANINRKRSQPFFPVLIKQNIAFDEMAILSTFQDEFPGVSVEYDLIRNYPFSKKTSHLLGFINWADDKILAKAPKNKIASHQKIGQSGVEGAFNDLLIGEDGGIQNEVNSNGHPIRLLRENVPTPGSDIYLTVDSELQNFIYDNMPGRGAVILMDAHNANIIATVSNPGFDPSRYVEGISHSEWQELLNDPESSLSDRCLQGTYSPGSTFKMLLAVAGLSTNTINFSSTFSCKGYFRHGRILYHCWKKGGHGHVNVENALEVSCNVFFYNLGEALGINNIVDFAGRFGFGKKTGISLPHELSGILPSPQWKLDNLKQRWLPGETINISIGQGYLTVTPLQLLTYLNALINGGWLKQPSLLSKIQHSPTLDDPTLKTQTPEPSHQPHYLNIDDEILNSIKRGMYLCVNSKNGTGIAARSNFLEIAGKTGTTQVVSLSTRRKLIQKKGTLEEKYQNHAWFIGYVPSRHLMPGGRLYSIAVLLENADTSSHAAAFARKVLEFFAQTKKTPHV